MLEKLKKHLIENDYYYEDVTHWYFKKIGNDNISITIGNSFIDIRAYKGKQYREMITSDELTEKDLTDVINVIKEWEKWLN